MPTTTKSNRSRAAAPALPGLEDSVRQAAGKKANKSGGDFERRLDQYHRRTYFPADRAAIDRLSVPTVPAGVRGQPMLRRIAGGSGVDFWGQAMLGGAHRAVCIECKHTSEHLASLPVVIKRRVPDPKKPKGRVVKGAGLDLDQLDYLVHLATRFGVVAVLLWESVDQIGVLPPGHLRKIQADVRPEERVDPRTSTLRKIPRRWFRWLEPGDLDWLSLLDRVAFER